MSNRTRMLEWFRFKRRATLGEIIKCGESWSYEFRARKTELNAMGGPQIVLAERHPEAPSLNVYELRESANGQYEFPVAV